MTLTETASHHTKFRGSPDKPKDGRCWQGEVQLRHFKTGALVDGIAATSVIRERECVKTVNVKALLTAIESVMPPLVNIPRSAACAELSPSPY